PRSLGEAAAPHFRRVRLLEGDQATKEVVLSELQSCSVAQFSGYGYDNRCAPLNSGLIVARDEVITLRDLLGVDLRRLTLAVLSGIDAAVPDSVGGGNAGLAFDLLSAGIRGVVAPMWLVGEVSTTLLLTRFYESW